MKAMPWLQHIAIYYMQNNPIGDLLMKNYKLQNTNYKGGGTPGLLGIPNYKLQITKKMAHELHEFTRISEKKEINITTTKGGHGLHKGSLRLQTMTAFNQKFLRGGPGGAVFSKSAPPGRRRQNDFCC